MNKNDLKLKLVTSSPIPFECGNITQPTISDIINIGEEMFDTHLMPFAVSLDLLDLNEEQKKSFKTFDLLFLNNNDGYLLEHNKRRLLDILVESLKFFFRTDNVSLYMAKNDAFIFMDEKFLQPKILIDNLVRIDRNNFDKLQELILLICQREKVKKPKEEDNVVFKNDVQKKRYEQYMARKRKADKEKAKKDSETTAIANLINVIETKRESNLDYNNTSIYKLIHIYKDMFAKEQYDNTMRIASSGMASSKELDLTHWSEKVKL